MRSLKWKLVVIYLTLVFIVMLISGTFIILRLDKIETDNKKRELVAFAELIAENVVLSYSEPEFQYWLEQFSRTSPQVSHFQGNILNSYGKTLATTVTQTKPYPSYSNSCIIEALYGKSSFSLGKWDTDVNGLFKEWLCYAYPVKTDKEVQYVVFVRMDASPIRESLSKTTVTIIVSVFIALILTCFIGFIFANTLTEPIIMLTKKAKDLARGKLNQDIEVKSNDEIGQLTKNFNFMAKELNSTMSTISSEKSKLETVLQNMTDGVLAFDSVGSLIHANLASHELLETDPVELTWFDLLKKLNIDIEEFSIKQSNTKKKAVIYEGNKCINVNIAPFTNERSKIEGIIVVLQDITEQTKLDNMRKEFVANVSHELRTPLTTVKSYAETLIDGAIYDTQTALEFLDIIDSETDRMALLVHDLLQLSRIDNNQLKLNIKPTDINELVQKNITLQKIHADQKQQQITMKTTTTKIILNIDPDRITQVFNNIFINAIKYSGENAKIEITTEETADKILISVKDNGMGIPKEDLPRIFERFYRVDKARSRTMGGTGLGLAIAKEIMHEHKGTILVESQQGKGTIMTIVFPKE